MKVRRGLEIGRLAFAALLLIGLTQPPGSRPARAGDPQIWLVTWGTKSRFAAEDPALSQRLFGSPRALVLGGVPGGVAAGLSWASEAAFEKAIREQWIPASVTTVMYDPENWPSTPVDERVDPVGAMDAFAVAARAKGYKVILTPHPGLMTVPGGRCTVGPGEAIENAYVRCDIAGQAAKVADIVETQAQSLEANPAAYRAFVEATAAQARAANPKVQVLSGLSTSYVGSPVQLYAAWYSVSDIVDGHYLAVPGGLGFDVALAFLRLLPQ